jgi:4-hydroxybenzoate polyprenyltransferase
MTLRTALRLGRVSNLPTVWTNVLAGIALNGGNPTLGRAFPVALAASLFYVAGMYLNDAFDHRWDAQHRPDRPIPAGEAEVGLVLRAGFGLMGAGFLVLAFSAGSRAALAGAGLGACILFYNACHKTNPFASVVMGLCRVAVYVIGALAVAPRIGAGVVAGSIALFGYLVVLTLIARHETRNPRLPALVGSLIAGISLLDALMLLVTGHLQVAVVAAFCFPLTRRLQRRVPGT